ncbi:MAG: bifunctional diaminohydroxyphosphoribosylaminopyrimidine deaminase/5-amino-6-(5-phosphoribosylamino)uracil reductase RibD [Phycisphaerales bacterium]|nr:bifunctional diaminohydroxyphosphoribosylaminopyrimidine deaminase/5-amino-6-(5-phosphoribosylamino)uracil reductase RibD [Phycisphaerales bacterium]
MNASADEHWLSVAARLAVRGHGGAEPNPMVGCVIIGNEGAVVGWGYHARCGFDHAEAAALTKAGASARGATAFVTLEPCAHHGRTPPCCDALIASGVKRVVYAVSDPHSAAAGGAARMRTAGIDVQRISHAGCERVSAPFACRMRSHRPWVIAKWAQTLDGRTATRSGDSRWISGAASRAMVHRERGRVDAVMVGIGTVLADNPNLLPRISFPRRIPRRVIIDPGLVIPLDAQVIRTANAGLVCIAAHAAAIHGLSDERRHTLTQAGVRLRPLSTAPTHNPHRSFRGLRDGSMAELLRDLYSDGVSTLLVEGGAGLLGALFDEDLVDDAWCFTAPLAIGDGSGVPIATGCGRPLMIDAVRYELIDIRRRGSDAMLLWRRKTHCGGVGDGADGRTFASSDSSAAR